jgi:putative exosortase-associated protein (TIGR04073 family)
VFFVIGRKKTFWAAFLVILACFAESKALDAGTYTDTLKKDFGRGGKNLLTAPLEIPIAVQDAHERSGWPVARQTLGLFEGVFKTVNRANAGFWEIVTALLPGPQGKIPIQPETLF